MTLSGGALGISIAFIHNVAPHPKHTWVIGVSWTLFAMSLLLILVSFLTSEQAIVRMVTQHDEGNKNIPRGELTDYLNWASAGTFVLGVIFLVIFALTNV